MPSACISLMDLRDLVVGASCCFGRSQESWLECLSRRYYLSHLGSETDQRFIIATSDNGGIQVGATTGIYVRKYISVVRRFSVGFVASLFRFSFFLDCRRHDVL